MNLNTFICLKHNIKVSTKIQCYTAEIYNCNHRQLMFTTAVDVDDYRFTVYIF